MGALPEAAGATLSCTKHSKQHGSKTTHLCSKHRARCPMTVPTTAVLEMIPLLKAQHQGPDPCALDPAQEARKMAAEVDYHGVCILKVCLRARDVITWFSCESSCWV